MTSTTNNTPLSHYFAACNEPLLGSDPFLLVLDDAWDADLHPDEYGDQSGVVRHSWDDDNASFTDDSDCSGDDNDDCDNDADDDQSDTDSQDDHHRRSRHRQEEWSLVYTASITVVATTTTTSEEEEKSDKYDSKTTSSAASKDRSPPMNPLLNPQMHRRDSKVRFCEEPPTIVCYEHCSREEYSQLYYSVHELQKIIDEVRMETTTPPLVATTKTSGPASVASAASLAANNRKAADNNMGVTTTVRTTLRST